MPILGYCDRDLPSSGSFHVQSSWSNAKSMGNIFQRQAASARAEESDREHNHEHRDGDKRENTGNSKVAQEESNEEAAEDCAGRLQE